MTLRLIFQQKCPSVFSTIYFRLKAIQLSTWRQLLTVQLAVKLTVHQQVGEQRVITPPEADSKSMSQADSSKIIITLNLYYSTHVHDLCTQCAVVHSHNMINVLLHTTVFLNICTRIKRVKITIINDFFKSWFTFLMQFHFVITIIQVATTKYLIHSFKHKCKNTEENSSTH